jgi:hypothetical protein
MPEDRRRIERFTFCLAFSEALDLQTPALL